MSDIYMTTTITTTHLAATGGIRFPLVRNFLGGGNSKIFMFTQNLGEDEPNLTIIFCKWVGSTTGKLHPPFFVGGLDISLGDLSKTLVALTERVEQMEGKGHQTMEAGDRTWVE